MALATNSAPMVEGTFGRVTMDDLLGVVSMSRQCLELVLGEAGSITVKSGQVLQARSGPGEEGASAFFSLYGKPGSQFAVYRRDGPPPVLEPIGTVSSLVERARRLPDPGTTLLAGSFDNFSFAELIGAVSTSRQPLTITLIRADGSRALIRVKSGLVLGCEDPGPYGPRNDRDSLHSVLRNPGRQFVVTKLAQTPAGPPIARLADLAAAALKQSRKQLLLEGRLADFPLVDVLSTLTLTRQAVELSTTDASGLVGQLLLKAGQVLEVRTRETTHPGATPSGPTGKSAFDKWLERPGDTFQVSRAKVSPGVQPLGRLGDWLVASRAPEPPAPKPLLEGRFTEFPLRDVLAVLANSRQGLALDLWRDAEWRGRLLVKSGMVVDARSSEPLIDRFACDAVLADPGTRFAVTRAALPADAAPIVRIGEMLAPPKPAPTAPTVVLEGRFAETPLVELLGVLSVSRSCFELRVPRPSGSGCLVVKGGQLLFASVDAETDPVRAIAALINDPGDSFTVLRREMPTGALALGLVSQLVADAQHHSEDLATVVEFPSGNRIDVGARTPAPAPSRPATPAPAPPRAPASAPPAPVRTSPASSSPGGPARTASPTPSPAPRAPASSAPASGPPSSPRLTNPAQPVPRSRPSAPPPSRSAPAAPRGATSSSGTASGASVPPAPPRESRGETSRPTFATPGPAPRSGETSRPSLAPPADTRVPAPADPRVPALAARLESLEAAFNAEPRLLDEAIATIAALEKRISAQDRALEVWARSSRTDRLLVVLALLAQLATAAAVVGASLWTTTWNR
jgi:hypothetical protein